MNGYRFFVVILSCLASLAAIGCGGKSETPSRPPKAPIPPCLPLRVTERDYAGGKDSVMTSASRDSVVITQARKDSIMPLPRATVWS